MNMDPGKLYNQLAWYRTKIKLYMAFCAGAPVTETNVEEIIQSEEEFVGQTFALERDLQAALRSNIKQLESELEIADGGVEARVEGGLIDILAKDAAGHWVVIELKSEIARPSALTQLLAYMSCVQAERGGEVRGILIASDFDRKISLAARALPNLALRRYRFQFSFESHLG